MFYRLTDTDTSHADWIALNLDAMPGDLIVQAHPEPEDAYESIHWLNPPEPDEDEDEDEAMPPTLHGGLIPAWGTVWTLANGHDDREELREALDASGFDLFEVQHPDHPIGFFFGIDGGGYSFYGQHWIPLRAHLLSQRLRWWMDGDQSERPSRSHGTWGWWLSDSDTAAKRGAWDNARACAGQWEADMAREGEDLRARCPELYAALRDAEAQLTA